MVEIVKEDAERRVEAKVLQRWQRRGRTDEKGDDIRGRCDRDAHPGDSQRPPHAFDRVDARLRVVVRVYDDKHVVDADAEQ